MSIFSVLKNKYSDTILNLKLPLVYMVPTFPFCGEREDYFNISVDKVGQATSFFKYKIGSCAAVLVPIQLLINDRYSP
jgi:hypothetical protein